MVRWPRLKRTKKKWPKVTVEEAKKMGINPVELHSDPGYVLTDHEGKPMPLEWFEFIGD